MPFREEEEEYTEHRKLLHGGVAFILLSIAAAVAVQYWFPTMFPIVVCVASIISSAGVALVIIALVESRHLQQALESTSVRIIDRSSMRLDDKFKETFGLLDHAKYNGLEDVLAPRQDEANGSQTRSVISEQIRRSKEILVCCISGLDFFAPPAGAKTSAGDFYMAIWDRIEASASAKRPLDLQIKVLLLDPGSEAAIFRNKIEAINGSSGDIRDDIIMAIDGINRLNTYAGVDFIQHRQYSCFPISWFVHMDTCVFVEQYHFAPTEKFSHSLQELGLRASRLQSTCTGGRVPVLRYRIESNMYIAMQLHFDSIWELGKQQNATNDTPVVGNTVMQD